MALFLSLLPERLLTDGVRLTPRFSLSKPEGLLISLKGFVSNTAANSLTMFDKTGPAAADVLATGAQPKGLALDQARELLYVALSGDNAIEVVEVNNAAIFGKVFLRPGDDPSEVVLGRDGRILVSINPGSHTASIVDTSSLTEVDRIRFNAAPVDIFPSAAGSRAFVLLPEINSIARLDFSTPRRTGVGTASLDETPLRGIASEDGTVIYLLTSFSSNLLVLDQATLSLRSRIYIGSGAQDLVEERGGLVFVAKRSGEIAVVDPSVGAIIDSFQASKGVRFMTLDTDQNALFTVYPQRGVIEKIDLVSKKTLGVLETGASPHAAAVMGER
jgi:DNA-binding beta-propeller fold protein YncE